MTPHGRIVIMDCFEERSGMREALEAIGVKVAVERLVLGDYLVGRGSIVERKTVLDFHLSVRQGRLWPQVWSISASERRGYLLIEGAHLSDGPLGASAVRGAVLTVVARGVGVLFAESVAESAKWLGAMARRDATRSWRPPGRLNTRAQARTTSSAAERALTAIPGISLVLARSLLDRYGSVAEVAARSTADLSQVPGIGSARASSIAQTLQARRGSAS